jgi:hypothetical protein
VPLSRSQADHHDPFAVLGGEVAPERPVQVIAVLGPLVLIDLNFGDLAEVPDHRERHVGQGNPDELTNPLDPPLALSG